MASRLLLVLTAVHIGVCTAQNVEKTVFEFSRASQTCDPQDNAIDDGTQRIVWSYSDEKPTSDVDMRRHDERGTRSLNLKGQLPDPVVLEPDVQTFEIHAGGVEVRSGTTDEVVDTLYYCKTFEIPEEVRSSKKHIVRMEPIIADEMLPHMHHILVYTCPVEVPLDEGDCNVFDQRNCPDASLILAWTIGANGWSLPAVTGFPVGPGEATHLYVQYHYDNPQLEELVDDSGIRFYYTGMLREHDSGILNVGVHVPSMYIPPGEPAFESEGYCYHECTEDIPSEGVTMYGHMLHAHLLGRKIKLQHIRDGQELPPLGDNQHYDFDFQETVALKPERAMLPGDSFITTCTYDSTGRTEPTLGGEATYEEMCLAYISYYPRQADLTGYCVSAAVTGSSDGLHRPICAALSPIQQRPPIEYEPMPEVDPCVDYTKPPIDVTPRLMAPGDFDRDKYAASMFVDNDEKYRLYWHHDYTDDSMHFAVEVEATGWVGFGISPNGDMTGSDVVIAYIDEFGLPHLMDRIATARSLPDIDVSQDVFNIRGMQAQLPRVPDKYSPPIAAAAKESPSLVNGDGGAAAAAMSAGAVVGVVLAVTLLAAGVAGALYKSRSGRKAPGARRGGRQEEEAELSHPQFKLPVPTEKTALVAARS